MKKVNKLLSLVICFAMLICCLPSGLLVSADDVTEDIVSVDLSTNVYNSVEDAIADGWTDVASNTYTELKIDENDGYLMYYHSSADQPSGGIKSDGEKKLSNNVIAIDEGISTYLTASMLKGKYQIDLTMEAFVTYVNAPGNAPYGTVQFVDNNGKLSFAMRISPTTMNVMSSDSASTDNITGNFKNYDLSQVTELKLSAVVDTVEGTFEGYLNDNTEEKYIQSGTLANAGVAIKGFKVTSHTKMDTGSYLKFKNIKITQLSADYSDGLTAKLNELPDALTESHKINALKENIVIPSIDGVTWTSSDESVINSTTGKVTRSTEEDKKVTLTAAFTVDGVSYTKNYEMTVKQSGVIVSYYADGELYDKVEIDKGTTASSISAPEKEHYVFDKWYDKATGEEFDFNTVLNQHTELYAVYAPKTYNVIFKDFDGNVVETLTGKYGSTVEGPIPELPEKEGYTAVDWMIGDTDKVFTEATIIDGEIIVNAKYIEGVSNYYTVTFKVDGETYKEETVLEGFAVGFPKAPEKENYTFDKWQLDGVDYVEGTAVTGNITLDAVFKPVPMSVTFFDDDKTTKLYTGIGLYNEKYADIPENPVKDGGYKFAYWETEDGEKFDSDFVVTKPISVYAVYTSTRKVVYYKDLTTIKTVAEAEKEGWYFSSSDHAKAGVGEDGGIEIVQIKSTPYMNLSTQNATQEAVLGADFYGILEEDKANRTRIKTTKFVGKYQFDLTLHVNQLLGEYPDEYTGAKNGPFIFMTMGTNETGTASGVKAGPLTFRSSSTTHTPLNSTSLSSSSFKGVEYPTGNPYTMHMVFDTRDGQVTTWINDGDKQTGKPYAEYQYFNAFSVKNFQRSALGSFAKFKDVKITLIEEDSTSPDYIKCMDILSSLPAKLSEDPYNVTGNLNLPKNSNVTWTTSNPAIVGADGTVKRWFDDYEITVYATVKSGSHSYVKEYDITVLKLDDVESKLKLENTFDSEADLINWEFNTTGLGEEGIWSVDSNGVKVEKISAAEDVTETAKNPVYSAYYDLYSEEDSGIFAKDYKGTYDIDFSAMASVNSQVPATVSWGYRSGEGFYDVASLCFDKGQVCMTYRPTAETEDTVFFDVLTKSVNDYKLRIDTVNSKMWLFVNGTLITPEGVTFNVYSSENGYSFNSLKITLDKNNVSGDFLVIDKVKLIEYVGETVSGKADAISAAAMINENAVPSEPTNLSGLPASVDGYAVEWKSTTEQIDIHTGDVYYGDEPVNAVVSAYVNVKGVIARRDYNVIIRKAQSDSEVAEYELNSIGKITKQPYTDIRYDLDLPSLDGVVWTSSDTDIITNDGKINRNTTVYVDTNVVMTATKNGVSKAYPLTVKKYSPFKVIASADNVTTDGISVKAGDIDNVKFTGNVLVNVSLEAGKNGNVTLIDSNGTPILKIVNSADGVAFDYSSASGRVIPVSGVANISIYLIPELQRMAIWLNDEIIADRVKFKGNANDFAKVFADNNEVVKSVEIKADSYTLLKSNYDNITYFDALSKNYVNANVELVTDSIFGSKAVWSTDNSSLITADGVVGNIDSMGFATLTLTLTDSDDSNINAKYSEKIAVDMPAERNIATSAKVTVSNHESPDAPKKNVNDNNIDTAFALTKANSTQYVEYDFEENVYFSTVYVNHDGGLRDYDIMISDDAKTWKSVKKGAVSDSVESGLIYLGGIESARYLRIAFSNSSQGTININEIKVYLKADKDDLAKLDIESITIPKTASSNLVLPEKGNNGTKFVWSSSNEDVITKDGKVTATKETVTVTLTVSTEDSKFSRTFDVTVKGSGNSSGPAVIGGSGGSGGGGGAGGSAGGSAGVGNSGLIGSVDPGEIFTTEGVPAEDVENKDTSVYADVKASDWYYESVMMLTEKGILSGDGTGKFNPSDNVTREQLVKMILIATDTELSTSTNKFDDVVSGAWYEQYIITAKENGIVNGITDKVFGIGSNIARQDMAVIIARLLEKKGYTFEGNFDKFADDASISDYAYDAVYAMRGLGLINGSDGKYNPKDNLTRAEAAKVISSLIKFLEEK